MANAVEDVSVAVTVAVAEEGRKAGGADPGSEPPGVREELRFRSEQDAALGFLDVERLDPHAVAGQVQRVRLAVIGGEREHPVQSREEIGSEAGEPLEDDLGVRASAPAADSDLGPQFLEVVDLAVVAEDESTVGRDHRLISRGAQVDDRKPPVEERDPFLLPGSESVGAAVCEDRAACRSQRLGPSERSGDSAHAIALGRWRAGLRPAVNRGRRTRPRRVAS